MKNQVPTWALALLSALWFAAMFGAAFAVMQGVPVLDARATGYDLATAREFASGLDADQRSFLLGPLRWMDTGFPPLLAFTLWRLAGPWRQGWVLPLIYMLIDWAENAVVAGLLRGDATSLDAKRVMLASDLTQAKYVVLAVAAIGLSVRWWRRRV